MTKSKKDISTEEKYAIISKQIKEKKFKTQDEIVKYINANTDLNINQTFISRNLENIGIDKNNDGLYRLEEEINIIRKRKHLKKDLLENCTLVDPDPHFISFEVKKGYAEHIGYQLKQSFPNNIIGTIANDELILVICKDKESIQKELEDILK